jgi:uncharacterized membrane protein (UPF0127 family)
MLRCVLVFLFFATPALACDPLTIDLRHAGAQVRFSIEIADEPEEQKQGLMHRSSLGQFSGMLFVYPKPQPAHFWMKNTLIPLDMLFLDAAGRVSAIHANTVPLSLETLHGGDAVRAVLEINGGLAETLGIGVGAEARHPAFGAAALWPCGE